MRQQRPEPAARTGDDDPLAGHRAGGWERVGDLDRVGHGWVLYRSVQYTTVTAHGDADRAFSGTELVEMQRRMLVIRGFEERVAGLYRDGLVPGFVHLSIGQEASAVGACWPLRPEDVITSTHRGHGHCLAKGLDPVGMFAELMGRDQGTNRGRGGSMHIADPTRGDLRRQRHRRRRPPDRRRARPPRRSCATRARVAVAFFGDGAAAQGAFHEALNLAAVWRLPVIFFCENNGYSEFSAAADQHAATLEARAGRLRAALRGRGRERRRGHGVGHAGRRPGRPHRRGPGPHRGRHLPLARPLRGRPAALPRAGRGGGVAAARPAAAAP